MQSFQKRWKARVEEQLDTYSYDVTELVQASSC